MRLSEIWRYPVKSLQGEQLESAVVTADGVEGDRQYAIFDVETGFGLTARRVPELLFASARWRDDGTVGITLPDGSTAVDDDVLSRWLDRPVVLRPATAATERRYENPADFDGDEESGWAPFDGAPGPFHDSARTRVSIVSSGSLGSWDRRRFRANLVVEGAGEDALVGAPAVIGTVVLDVRKRVSRCVMTTRPQPGGIERDLDVLRTINRSRDGCLAIGALVTQPGLLRVGDELRRA